MIGYCFCGSFCTHLKNLEILKQLSNSYEIQPILSENAFTTDTKFGRAQDLIFNIENITGRKIIHTIKDAEPLGPTSPLEFMIISPCTGNTLAKIALGITDTSVTMAAKAHLRCDRPILIALATNDAMSANLKNLSTLLNRKSVYFVPMLQDSPKAKPHSLIADFSMIPEAIDMMNKKTQIRPLFK